jgi:CubicO group peptidase (beta-lactamase class C family)
MSSANTQRRLAAILAADVVGYSRLMGQDEAGTRFAGRRKPPSRLPALLVHVFVACLSFFLVIDAAALEQSRLDKVREKFGVPAVGYAFIHNGQSEAKVSGSRIAGQDIPVKVTDKFPLYSLTKAMLATLVQIYVDRHLLDWRMSLDEALPDFTEKMDEQFRHVTIEMLTSHRSGISWRQPTPDPLRSDLDSREGRWLAVRELLSVKPRYKPGSFIYSNWNYVIVGTILERLTGQSWEQLMGKELFAPLGMESCGLGSLNAGDTDLSQPWEHEKVGSEFSAIRTDNSGTMGPADAVFCSMEDYLKFAEAHLDGFHGRDTIILPATSFQKLHEPAPAQHYTYGGWIRVKPAWSGSPALHHQGWVDCSDNRPFVGSSAVVWIVSDSGYAIVAVTNAGDMDYGGRVTNEVVRSVVDILP